MKNEITLNYKNFADPENGLLKYLANNINRLISREDRAGLQQLVNDIAFVADSLYDLNDEVEPKLEEFAQLKNKKEALEEFARNQAAALKAINDKLNSQFGMDEDEEEADSPAIAEAPAVAPSNPLEEAFAQINSGIDIDFDDDDEVLDEESEDEQEDPEELLNQLDAESIIGTPEAIVEEEEPPEEGEDVYDGLVFGDDISSMVKNEQAQEEDSEMGFEEIVDEDLMFNFDFGTDEDDSSTSFKIPPSVMNNMGEDLDPGMLTNGMSQEELARQIYEESFMNEEEKTTAAPKPIGVPLSSLSPATPKETAPAADVSPLASADSLFDLDDDFASDTTSTASDNSLSSQLGLEDDILSSVINDADDDDDDYYYEEEEDLSAKPMGSDEADDFEEPEPSKSNLFDDEDDDDDDFNTGMLDNDLF